MDSSLWPQRRQTPTEQREPVRMSGESCFPSFAVSFYTPTNQIILLTYVLTFGLGVSKFAIPESSRLDNSHSRTRTRLRWNFRWIFSNTHAQADISERRLVMLLLPTLTSLQFSEKRTNFYLPWNFDANATKRYHLRSRQAWKGIVKERMKIHVHVYLNATGDYMPRTECKQGFLRLTFNLWRRLEALNYTWLS